jgi:transcriptional regulator with XRE-family HTH domain
MSVLAKFPERLKDLISERNINASDLARLLNVRPSTVSRYLKGNCLPTYASFIKLLETFHCSADFLLGLIDFSPDNVTYLPVPPFHKRFHALMKEYGMTQYTLHRKTNFSYDNFNKWLKNRTRPYIDNLEKLAQAFDCSVDYLIGRVL